MRKSPIALAMLACLLTAARVPGAETDPDVVRVGVVAFEDFEREHREWESILSEFSREPGSDLKFELAAGTYGDLLHWMKNQWIDVGILTSGVFAESRKREQSSGRSWGYEYVATVGLPPAVSPWSAADRKAPGYHYQYGSACIVREDSPLESLDDVARLAASGGVEFVFVDPFSVSGRILPAFSLRSAGITPPADSIHYSRSHSGSLRRLTESEPDRERVAFVWDDALRDLPRESFPVRALPFPALDEQRISHDVVVARRDGAHFEKIRDLVLAHRDSEGQPDFRELDDWRERYGQIEEWSETAGLLSQEGETQKVSLDEIRQILVHGAKARPAPPRIALVLSGGGAKCSYQVGAVCALEEMIQETRRQHPDLGLDLNLIVGTSGGAINAVPIAMGLLKEPAGRADFQTIWKDLDQREIVRPSLLVRANNGIWFALLQIGVVSLGLKIFGFSRERRAQIFLHVMLVLAAGEILLGYVPMSPWGFLGENHFWHHLYLVCSFGFRTSAWILLSAGLLWFALSRFLTRRESLAGISRRPIGWVIGICLAVLPIIQVVTILWFQKTLSGGQGIEHALAEGFPRLVDSALARRNEPELDLTSATSDGERLAAFSRQSFSRGLWQRDLVITGNCIAQTSGTLPSDIYFFAGATNPPSLLPNYGTRGMNLAEHPRLLMDVVMGSGTIFPVFPPRTVFDFPESGDRIELIDGGFAHNSPIEAAVLWGATHLFLIEATPVTRELRKNFLQNAATAFVHLHKQTQLVDVRSKQQVMIFTLVPEPPHMCVLDFSGNLIEASISRGYRDASGGASSGGASSGGASSGDASSGGASSGDGDGGPGPAATAAKKRFRKELGEPVFTAVGK